MSSPKASLPALQEAIARGYVRAGEDCAASDAHYNAFEALCSGRNMHDASVAPTGLARRLFPAQVIKSCSMAHSVIRLVEESAGDAGRPRRIAKFLVLCGASHMAYNLGVPERVFAAHPYLEEDCYRIYAREIDGVVIGDAVEQPQPQPQLRPQPRPQPQPPFLEEGELRTIFGTGNNPADAVFVYTAAGGGE